MQSYTMFLVAAQFSPLSYSSYARSYSGAYIRSLGVYIPYLQLLTMGIIPLLMSEGNNTIGLWMVGSGRGKADPKECC